MLRYHLNVSSQISLSLLFWFCYTFFKCIYLYSNYYNKQTYEPKRYLQSIKPITDIDVISKIPFDAKKVTNNILKQILKSYSIDGRKKRKIKKLFIKRFNPKQKGLNVYIEMILTEKVERNNKN